MTPRKKPSLPWAAALRAGIGFALVIFALAFIAGVVACCDFIATNTPSARENHR